jgi:NADH:ubiquinone oxidoreductase subunit B-like Fe-S oxidoreductase
MGLETLLIEIPPRPEAVLEGIMKLQRKVAQESILQSE